MVDTLTSDWITTGPKTRRFEEKAAEYLGVTHTLALNSCTAALHLSLAAADIGEGDEVITSPLTFCATANVVLHQRARVVFVDVERDTFNLDPEALRSAITEKTKAVIPVHYAGQPCEMDEILSVAREHGLRVFEDAAHAIGATYRGRRAGTMGDTGCYSFYAIKNMTTGEGGLLATNDDEIAERARILSLHGISKDAWKRYSSQGSWFYEVTLPGFKYNMSDLQASLGLHQLAKLDGFIERREQLARRYDRAFEEMEEIEIQRVRPERRHARHLYPVLIDLERLSIDRAQFIEALRAENIGSTVNFIPVHLHPYYRRTFGYQEGDYPVAEEIYRREISLPLFPRMKDSDVDSVVSAVRKIIARYNSS
ncbi:MAG: DegT/DnrJ/EryC1/StrS family aminotransferase [Candidatus Eisenbacteria sp.]|nr:DegT/DnrJ/EryC1/StrS family aminotransferase [Candidatus Eisenbacteria bacterium]